MSQFVFFLALLPIGLVTGWAVGAGLSFTGGKRRIDLVAGLLGAILVALPLHVLGPRGYSEALPALIVGVSAAMFSTWWTRILTWKPEPSLRTTDEARPSRAQSTHDVMTTAEGTALLLSGGKLTIPDRSGIAPRTHVESAGVGD